MRRGFGVLGFRVQGAVSWMFLGVVGSVLCVFFVFLNVLWVLWEGVLEVLLGCCGSLLGMFPWCVLGCVGMFGGFGSSEVSECFFWRRSGGEEGWR